MTNCTEWRDVRLKDLFISVRNGVWGDDPDEETDVFCARGTDFDRVTRRISDSKMPRRNVIPRVLREHQLHPGDLVLEKSGGSADQPVGSVALFDLPVRTVCSNFNARLQVHHSVDPRFACYLMNGLYWSGFTRQFVKQTTGIQNLDAEELLAQHCLVAPLGEQRRISDFLDAETARIDQIIAIRTLQSGQLDERESSWRTRMFEESESGEWMRVKHLLHARPRYGVLVPEFVNDGVPLIRVNNLHGLINLDGLAMIPNYLSAHYPRTVTMLGDVLVSVVGSLGKVAVVNENLVGANVNRAIAILRLHPQHLPSLFATWVGGIEFKRQALFATSADSAQSTLGMEDLANFSVRWPVESTEREVMANAALEHQLETTAAHVAINRQLALLAERRQALITAAVTGAITI